MERGVGVEAARHGPGLGLDVHVWIQLRVETTTPERLAQLVREQGAEAVAERWREGLWQLFVEHLRLLAEAQR